MTEMTAKQQRTAKVIDKVPQFRYAVFSRRDGQETYELESSFAEKTQAESMFERQYSKWGMTETTFYLADWDEQVMLKTFKAVKK